MQLLKQRDGSCLEWTLYYRVLLLTRHVLIWETLTHVTNVMHFKWEVTRTHRTEPIAFQMEQSGRYIVIFYGSIFNLLV